MAEGGVCVMQKGAVDFEHSFFFFKTNNLHNFNFVVREYDEQREAILDGSCTDNTTSVCKPALLHAR
jgi:hypothetical protein